MNELRYFEEQQIKGIKKPYIKPGDVVRVEMKIAEGEKTRLQTFEGMIIGMRGSGPSASFTVRRETGGFGVERIFPLYSPLVSEIEIVRRQKVRRAQLNYLRQEGRRRFKEDIKAMQRHLRLEEKKRRLAEEETRRLQQAKDEERKKDETKEREEDQVGAAEEKAVSEEQEKEPVIEETEAHSNKAEEGKDK